MASMCVERQTARAISPQILRHRSFSFQEHSTRYAVATELELPHLRRQDVKNRQNSTDDLPADLKIELYSKILDHFTAAQDLYNELLEADVAKECARFVLPLATPTRLYMTGSVRSWITYIALREKNGTQKEHMDIAKLCKEIFCEQFPTTAEALGGIELEWKT